MSPVDILHLVFQILLYVTTGVFLTALGYGLYCWATSSVWWKRWQRHRMAKKRKGKEVWDFATMITRSQVRHTTCCGACELYNLEYGPLGALAALAAWQKGKGGFGAMYRTGNFKPLVLFTDRVNYQNGEALAEYIREHNLGELVETRDAHNYNSGYKVQGWLWAIGKNRWNAWVNEYVVGLDDLH